MIFDMHRNNGCGAYFFCPIIFTLLVRNIFFTIPYAKSSHPLHINFLIPTTKLYPKPWDKYPKAWDEYFKAWDIRPKP